MAHTAFAGRGTRWRPSGVGRERIPANLTNPNLARGRSPARRATVTTQTGCARNRTTRRERSPARWINRTSTRRGTTMGTEVRGWEDVTVEAGEVRVGDGTTLTGHSKPRRRGPA